MRISSDALQEQLDYWKEQLRDTPSVIELPVDHLRLASQTFRRESYSFTIPEALSGALHLLASQQNITFFTLLLTAFFVQLYHYTDQEDLLVGSPVAGRSYEETENMPNSFVNLLALRGNLSGNPPFVELLRRVKEMVLAACEHQDLPFERILQELHIESTSSYSPLVQVLFTLQNNSTESGELQRLTVHPQEIDAGNTKYDITLALAEINQELSGTIEYNIDLFNASTIERMAQHFCDVLTNMVHNPTQRLSQLPLLTDAERQQMLIEWNATTTIYPEDSCVQELFEQQVERAPDVVAVVYENAQVTYREINRRANQLAHYLRTCGVGPEVRVGICVERSLEMVIGLLAILKAGGAYVPLDPAYPSERLEFMLQDSQAAVLLTQEQLLTRLSASEVRRVCLNIDRELIAQQSEANIYGAVMTENLAYVIYTSGSTGWPKGVAMPHRSLINLLHWQLQISCLDPDARTLQFTSLSFDVAFQEILATWCAGGVLHLISEEQRRDLSMLARLLVEERIERLFLPFIALQQLVEVCVKEQLWPDALKEVNTAGEQLQVTPALRTFFEKLSTTTLQNQYGPSETHVITAYTLEKGARKWEVLPPIGKAIANTRVYLCNRDMQPVPAGVIGELYLGGAGVALGYLSRPEVTAERFVPDQLSGEPGARLYRTGDLARYRPDGNLEYLGRIDRQMKIRGFRIEPGEIEAILTQHPALREAVVVAQEGESGYKRLVAYLIPEQLPAPSFHALRGYLQERLPDYMLPSAFMLLDALPLTPNLKVDRNALPTIDDTGYKTEETSVAPRTSTEQLITAIWTKVLGKKQFSIYNTFFELGGDSISATQIISSIREAFHVELPIQLLFDTPTIAALAEYLENIMQTGRKSHTSTIVPRSPDTPPPLSVAQQRLWVLEQLAPETTMYTIPLAFKLQGQIDTTALKQSLNEIVSRHQSLRTSFVVVDGYPCQSIAATLWLDLTEIDLQERPAGEREDEMRRRLKQEIERPFDLNHGPLLRAYLLQLDEHQHALLIVMHHLVSDGWSVDVFLRELAALYRAYAQGHPSPLLPLPIQYADFAVWQRQWLQTDMLIDQLAYWKKQLTGVPALLALPTDHPRPAVQTFRGAAVSFTLTQRLTHALKTLSQHEHITLFMTLLAAFQVLLFRYTWREDIVVGVPIAARTQQQTEDLIGFFVNTLVLRSDLSGNPSFYQLLQRVRAVALEAYKHQDLPFEQLVKAMGLERSLSYNPLFQIVFVLQNVSGEVTTLGDVSLQRIEIERTSAQFDLTLEMTETTDGLQGCLEYNSDLFEPVTITRMAGYLQILLEGIVSNPAQLIGELPLLDAAEQHQLLIEWNATSHPFPRQQHLCELFEEQVECTPDAVAVIHEEAQMTYREINTRSNQLAHYLQARGVGPEIRVGICVERSPELIIGLLGILKAGGAYVPLDPTYPQERLTFMRKDAQVALLLTQQQVLSSLPDHTNDVFCLDTDWSQLAPALTTNPINKATLTNLVYVIYTSGSTGKPKGTEITHQGLLNLVFWHWHAFDILETDRATCVAGLGFDAVAWEIWPYLCHGASISLVNEEVRVSSRLLRDWLLEQAVTITFLPTPMAEQMLDLNWPQNTPLRTLLTGGDTLQRAPTVSLPFRFINNYGPTENTVVASSHVVLSHARFVEVPSIGCPISNVQLYLLDQYLHPVPLGVAGEIYIGGAGVARGYLHLPGLTAERFIPDPFGEQRGARLYRTGDFARYRNDGTIEFLGRQDYQVKLRGYRIELGEIETQIARFPGVQECVVQVREESFLGKKERREGISQSEKRLVAYVVSQPEQSLTVIDVRHHLQACLPDYMLPTAFVLLEALPLTPNGKIDRQAFPAPEWGGSTESYLAPRTPTERILVDLWADVLGIEPQHIGIHDNFFALGGHSLLATQVVSQISIALQAHVPLRIIFEMPTVADLALHLDKKRAESGSDDIDSIQKVHFGNAEQLLMKLDQLSEQEIDILLGTLDAEEK